MFQDINLDILSKIYRIDAFFKINKYIDCFYLYILCYYYAFLKGDAVYLKINNSWDGKGTFSMEKKFHLAINLIKK